MAAANTDKFMKVGIQSATTLDANYTINDGTVTVASTSGWPTDTGITFAMDVIDSAGGQVAGTYNEFVGTVSTATSITNVDYADGTGDRNYTAGATTRVYIPVSKTRENRLVEGMLVEHDQDGTHSAITATSITATTGTFNSVTIAGTASAEGWSPLGATPNTVTANGNRSYDLVFNSNDLTDTLSPGMRIKATRTVTAPTQCASLNGTNHYFSKTTPSGAAQTDDITVSAWIKPTSYAAGVIMGKRTATNGWDMSITATGTLRIIGINASNFRMWSSYQSIPLNKWVHVAATLDMSGNTSATNKLYIDGVEVPAVLASSGAPSALVSAGDLTIGAYTGGAEFFPGKIAQVAAYSAVLSAATIKASMTQTLTGSETNLVSAYSLSNSLTDLNTGNANNLTAQNSAVATATDTPFAGGSVGTTEYGIVTAASFSTNTTLTVQVPEGYALPTTGGVSAVSYSINKIPYGFPIRDDKWELFAQFKNDVGVSGASFAQILGQQLAVPIGCWNLVSKLGISINSGGVNDGYAITTLSTSTSAATDTSTSNTTGIQYVASIDGFVQAQHHAEILVNIASTTNYYQLAAETGAIAPVISGASDSPGHIKARFCYL